MEPNQQQALRTRDQLSAQTSPMVLTKPITLTGSQEFAIKDSGARQEFEGGGMRDTEEGKVDFLNVRFGPMLKRWAAHLTKGRIKYPDSEPGVPNWTLFRGTDEYLRAKRSASRHFEQWLAGERDEDHAAAVFFNINVAEYLLDRCPEICPCQGVSPLR